MPRPARYPGHWLEVLGAFTRLGLTSFGGPVAHLGYFREAFVVRRKWLDERAYADLVALCQFLPGPASSQVGMAIGLSRAGYGGALAAWLAFTLPSALALTAFAYGIGTLGSLSDMGWVHGLKVAAVAVVAQAVLAMMRALAPDKERATLAVAAAAVVLAVPSAAGQIAAIALGALAAPLLPRPPAAAVDTALHLRTSRGAGFVFLSLFAVLLAGLPLAAALTGSHDLAIFEAFYRAGSLVFGGGHVILPLLEASVVPPGWVTKDAFLAGYGAAQAVPGPLFTFSAYLGAVLHPQPYILPGAALCLLAIFLPSFLLVFGALPFWEALRAKPRVQAAMRGVNAAVVGLLLAALYDPVWTAGIRDAGDFALAALALLCLALWRAPPWLVVMACAAGAEALAAL